MMSSIDPSYYSGHGYWIKSADYEKNAYWNQRIFDESHDAVALGRACWLEDAPNYRPF